MIIDKSTVNLQNQHQLQKLGNRKESLQLWQNLPQPKSEDHKVETDHQAPKDTVKLSDAAQLPATETKALDTEKQLGSADSLMLQIIKRIFKQITGEDFKLFSPGELQAGTEQPTFQEPQQPPAPTASANQDANTSTGSGMVYQQSTSYFESETSSFSAEGSITTADGQNISFSVSMTMSRTFYTESNLSLRAGDAAKVDPLVINFDGKAAELTSTKFQFDIDANGVPDQISGLKSGSGMLALDKNQDGKINDGSELFGPNSGDGFKELAAYDQDHNQFIDSADAIYKQLRIWLRQEDGSQQLLALGDKNIGAIYVGHLTTPFQMKDAANATQAEVASTGIYLTEQGQAGTVQQIDFTV